ncbi:UNVERIFIED_CONTAM: hypothetical protein Scaly_0256100 [Sesamum calycinum]|uniref:Transposase-associated domain-containing protein n=1 Tax=Sesamum calycinum TaxID=2727403 RepID=A0AAW2S8X8_9LAMI
MYEKNLPSRAGLTPEFKDGVTAFIQWAKSHHGYMESDKIKCPCWKCKLKFSKSWIRGSYPTDVGPSSYYGGPPYDYVFGLTDRFHVVVHAAEQPLWNGCTQSQLGVVTKLVDIKVDCHIFERIYDRTSQWADHILPYDHTLLFNYYNTKKLMKDLCLHMEKINAYKNSCMLYWKDNIDLEYYKFCGEVRYKSTTERNHNLKKTPYAILRTVERRATLNTTDSFSLDHPYHRNKKAFTKNGFERKVAHPRLTGEQIRDWVEKFSPTVEVLLSLPDDYGSEHKRTKKNIF